MVCQFYCLFYHFFPSHGVKMGNCRMNTIEIGPVEGLDDTGEWLLDIAPILIEIEGLVLIGKCGVRCHE